MDLLPPDFVSEELDTSLVRIYHAGDHVDHRALAGTVGTDQCMDVPVAQPEGHVLRRTYPPIRLRDPFDLEQHRSTVRDGRSFMTEQGDGAGRLRCGRRPSA